MSAQLEVTKGKKVEAAEVKDLEPHQIVVLLADTPGSAEVEGQTFCALIQCPYCGGSGRCGVSPDVGKYYRCSSCGAVFRT